VLVFDDRSAVGASADRPKVQHSRGRRWHVGACLLLVPGDRLRADDRDARNDADAAAACDDRHMPDVARIAIRLVSNHPAVRHVELAGSRSRGTHEELSDWDFAATTSEFAAVARDPPALIAAACKPACTLRS
jgi:hypothetical protein